MWPDYCKKETLARRLDLEIGAASPEWKQMKPKTRVDWERYCRRIKDSWGAYEVKGIEPKNVLTLRDLYASTPASANNLLPKQINSCYAVEI